MHVLRNEDLRCRGGLTLRHRKVGRTRLAPQICPRDRFRDEFRLTAPAPKAVKPPPTELRALTRRSPATAGLIPSRSDHSPPRWRGRRGRITVSGRRLSGTPSAPKPTATEPGGTRVEPVLTRTPPARSPTAPHGRGRRRSISCPGRPRSRDVRRRTQALVFGPKSSWASRSRLCCEHRGARAARPAVRRRAGALHQCGSPPRLCATPCGPSSRSWRDAPASDGRTSGRVGSGPARAN